MIVSSLVRFRPSHHGFRHRQAGPHHELARHALVAVACKNVPYLVPDHRRELVLPLRHVEESLVDADLLPRQGKRVGLVLVEDLDLPPLRLAVRQNRHDGVRDAFHVAVQVRTGSGSLVLDLVERRRAHVPHDRRREHD